MWGGRIFCALIPMLSFAIPGYRSGFFSLAHEMEISLADQGLSWFHIKEYEEIGFLSDFVLIIFLLWAVLIFYEVGKWKEWLLVIIPVVSSLWLFFMMDWQPGWWFYPMMLAESFLILMPSVAAWGAICAFTLILVCVLAFVLQNETEEHKGIWRAWQNWRYGVSSSALPEGDMRRASQMVRDDQVALTIQSKTESSYYLRGFVGNVYDGSSSWTNDRTLIRSLERGVWGSTIDVVDILHEKGYYGTNKLTEHKKIKQLNSYSFLIENVGANRKYLYLPYESKTGIDDLVEDGIAVNGAAESLYGAGMGGQDDYQCRAVGDLAGNTVSIMEDGNVSSINQIQSTQNQTSVISGQQSSADIYKEYIERIDLSLSKSTKTLIADQLKDQVSVSNISPQGAYETVRRWIKSNITYVEEPEAVPEDKDFLTWFLTEEKAGNDVYIASCATMMFRYLGIPARYVEGYLYQPSKFSNTTDVLQSDAHAWVEIYVENLGWIPVEVTEAYEDFTESYLPNYQATATLDAQDDDEEEEEEEEEESTESTEQDTSEQSSEEESTQVQNSGKTKNETSKYNWGALGKFVLYVLQRIVMIIGGILLLGVLGYLLWKLIRHYYGELRWKRSIQAAVCITEWYRHLMMCLYLLEDVKDKKFDEWDNRSEQISVLLLKYDQDCAGNVLDSNLEIYQKALFSSEIISWSERKQYVKFCEGEIKKIKNMMSVGQRLRLIFNDEFN